MRKYCCLIWRKHRSAIHCQGFTRERNSEHVWTIPCAARENPLAFLFCREKPRLAFRLGWFLLSDALADRKRHLAKAFVGVDDYVVAVQDLAIENLQGQRILH